MGIFARLAALLKSNLNDLISSSEDPEKMLNQIVLDMSNPVARGQTPSGSVHRRRKAASQASRARDRERHRVGAARHARRALRRRCPRQRGTGPQKEHQTLAEQFQEQWSKQKQAVDQLKLALRALNNKIEEAKRKKNLLIARKKRAEAQKAIQETMTGLKNASAFETFDRMAGRIEQMEAEAEAHAELNEEASGDTLAHKFRELEVTKGADEDLTSLKRKMGLLPPEPETAESEPRARRTDRRRFATARRRRARRTGTGTR